MKYIFGLGNPGRKYAATRHNTGFDVVDILAERHGARLKDKPKLETRMGDCQIGGQSVWLCEPQTFMNVSGYAVSAVLDYYKASPEDLIVVYDDIDLPFGTLRIREKGSAGTHNGMKSIVGYLKTEDFLRVRVGIGRPPEQMSLTAYVLGRFPDSAEARRAFSRAADAVECIVEKGVAAAQTQFREEKAEPELVPGKGLARAEEKAREKEEAREGGRHHGQKERPRGEESRGEDGGRGPRGERDAEARRDGGEQ